MLVPKSGSLTRNVADYGRWPKKPSRLRQLSRGVLNAAVGTEGVKSSRKMYWTFHLRSRRRPCALSHLLPRFSSRENSTAGFAQIRGQRDGRLRPRVKREPMPARRVETTPWCTAYTYPDNRRGRQLGLLCLFNE